MATYQILTLIGVGIFSLAYTQTEQIAFIMMIISRVLAGIGGEGLAIVCRKSVVCKNNIFLKISFSNYVHVVFLVQ